MKKLIKGNNNVVNKTIDFLIEQIKTDDQLRTSIEKEEKTVDKLENYIMTKAREMLKNKEGGIEKEVIYSWAIHYFIETEETINEELGQNQSPVKEIKEKPKKQVKPAIEALSIFDFLGDNV